MTEAITEQHNFFTSSFPATHTSPIPHPQFFFIHIHTHPPHAHTPSPTPQLISSTPPQHLHHTASHIPSAPPPHSILHPHPEHMHIQALSAHSPALTPKTYKPKQQHLLNSPNWFPIKLNKSSKLTKASDRQQTTTKINITGEKNNTYCSCCSLSFPSLYVRSLSGHFVRQLCDLTKGRAKSKKFFLPFSERLNLFVVIARSVA